MMSNETKRDVFDETLSNLKKMDAQIEGEFGYSQLTMGVGKHGDVESTREIAIAEIRDRYAAALPDDLPVIPKAVGEYLKRYKLMFTLFGFLRDAVSHIDTPLDALNQTKYHWIANNQNTFARAWLLGVWKVAETGEIVKLEEDK